MITKADQYVHLTSRAGRDASGKGDEQWNILYLSGLQSQGLTLSLTNRRGDKYPNGFGELAPRPALAGPLFWPPETYIVWIEDL